MTQTDLKNLRKYELPLELKSTFVSNFSFLSAVEKILRDVEFFFFSAFSLKVHFFHTFRNSIYHNHYDFKIILIYKYSFGTKISTCLLEPISQLHCNLQKIDRL